MKLASNHRQALELKCLYDFPEPDLVIEYFWASESHPYHMKSDEKLLKEYEDVDIVPAWSIGRLIEGLPREICVFKDEFDVDPVVYELQIVPSGEGMIGSDGYFAYVSYVINDGSDVLYETEALELVDALYEMIMKLHENGWYKRKSIDG